MTFAFLVMNFATWFGSGFDVLTKVQYWVGSVVEREMGWGYPHRLLHASTMTVVLGISATAEPLTLLHWLVMSCSALVSSAIPDDSVLLS